MKKKIQSSLKDKLELLGTKNTEVLLIIGDGMKLRYNSKRDSGSHALREAVYENTPHFLLPDDLFNTFLSKMELIFQYEEGDITLNLSRTPGLFKKFDMGDIDVETNEILRDLEDSGKRCEIEELIKGVKADLRDFARFTAGDLKERLRAEVKTMPLIRKACKERLKSTMNYLSERLISITRNLTDHIDEIEKYGPDFINLRPIVVAVSYFSDPLGKAKKSLAEVYGMYVESYLALHLTEKLSEKQCSGFLEEADCLQGQEPELAGQVREISDFYQEISSFSNQSKGRMRTACRYFREYLEYAHDMKNFLDLENLANDSY